MTIMQKLGIVLYGIACFVLTIILFGWSQKHNQEKLDEERRAIEQLQNEVQAVRAENESIREIMQKSDEAIEHAANTIQDAKDKADERENIIINDTPIDWREYELPASVQDMFADYCH